MSELKKLVINGNTYTVTDESAVTFDSAQSLTEREKAQARENIGAAAAGENGGGAMIVTVDADNHTNYTSNDIALHVRDGYTVTLYYNGRYYNLLSATEEGYAWFGYIDDGGDIYVVGIIGNDVESYELNFASTGYVENAINTAVGDIDTALDSIIAIQEELLGIFTFTLSGIQLKAEEGMTWAAWCDSEYNTVGVYTEPGTGYHFVYDNAGDEITLDGSNPVEYLDVIGPYAYTSL